MSFRNGSTIWSVTFLMAILTTVACGLAGFSLARSSVVHLAIGVTSGLTLFYAGRSRRMADSRIFHLLDGLLLLSIIGTIGAIMSYVSMQQSGHLTDDLLSQADQRLGFSWLSIRHFVDHRPMLYAWLNLAYFSCFIMPIVVVTSLSMTGQAGRMYEFISAFGLSLIVTVLVEYWFPARAAFSFYGYPRVPPSAVNYAATIRGLRDGSLTVIDLNGLSGIVTFPSFHAAMAVLFGWALCRVQIVRTLTLPLNGLMWCAAVPVGGHYVVDLIGGSIIAGGAILLVTRARVAAGERAGTVSPIASSAPCVLTAAGGCATSYEQRWPTARQRPPLPERDFA